MFLLLKQTFDYTSLLSTSKVTNDKHSVFNFRYYINLIFLFAWTTSYNYKYQTVSKNKEIVSLQTLIRIHH